MSHPLDEVLRRQKRGEPVGIASICSAHPWVLKAALRGHAPVLVESTCNQVNQFGGYTGMTPPDFARFVRRIAAENDFPPERILLGGDHLGPSPWKNEPARTAMQKAQALVGDCVLAGYTKIHLDASMHLGDDDPGALPLEVIARRTAQLARNAELAAPDPASLRYVIGSEVPIPGGATAVEEHLQVTSVADAQQTIEVTREAFLQAGLGSAWDRVIAMVVQPGVEFGDDFVQPYDTAAARELVRLIEPTSLVYEAHSTDYQFRESLRALVRDHFAILKVGPALTFAFRQAVFSLADIEHELIEEKQQSHILERLEDAMLRAPSHWQDHYHGTPEEQAFKRKNSLSDRIRYYWALPEVQVSLSLLLGNLRTASMPGIHESTRNDVTVNSPEQFVVSRIQSTLNDYLFACGGGEEAIQAGE